VVLRSFRGIVVVLVVSLVGVVAPAGAASGCVAAPGQDVVRATPDAVITVEAHTVTPPGEDTETMKTWRGCPERNGEEIELERGFSGGYDGRFLHSVRLGGAFVVYLVSDGDKYQTDTRVTVVDLLSGQRWIPDADSQLVGSLTSYADTAVNRLGNAAWIRETTRRGRREWQVVVWQQGTPQLHYRSRRELTRLRLGTRRVRWREHNKRRALKI
jgi:hypothetical protein